MRTRVHALISSWKRLKACFEVIFFAKTIQSYYLMSAVFKFLMKNNLTGGGGSLAKIFLQLSFYVDGFKNARRHPRLFWGMPFDLSFRGKILLYRNFVFQRSNLKDKTMYFLYSFRHLSQSILINSSKKHFLLNFWIFGVSFYCYLEKLQFGYLLTNIESSGQK